MTINDNNVSSPILYIALLGERDSIKFTNIPQESIQHPILGYIGCLPQSMAQFIYGIEYYQLSKYYGLISGYRLIMVYPDITAEAIKSLLDLPKQPHVILLCTEEERIIETYTNLLKDYMNEDFVCLTSDEADNVCKFPCTTLTRLSDIWKWFYDYANKNYEIDKSRLPFSVPCLDKSVYDTGDVFSPTRTNTQTINSILGNWDYSLPLTKDEILKRRLESSEAALNNTTGFERQNLLIEQITKIRLIENIAADLTKDIKFLEEHYRAPLILAAPYTSIEMRKLPEKDLLPEEEKMAQNLEKIMGYHQTHNYTVAYDVTNLPEELYPAMKYVLNNFLIPRSTFFDFVAQLHCSIRFSPYLRLPIMGKNINSELSFVGIKHIERLATSPNKNKNIRKVMEKIGKKMTDEMLSPEAVEMLQEYSSQIVAMTDLPIEWMMIDGVPLGFTHEMCRLPETPVTSLLAQYMEAKFRPYVIPEDILQKTLVVFGNEDPEFMMAQSPVRELAKTLGFQIKTCLDKASFFEAVKETGPELLIIDTHGGVDETTHNSFIMMGNDIVTGDDVVNSGIGPQLVFLSACNTFTTYNTINTIANAFFQIGANAVTTSYMPLHVLPATVLYIRLLRNLNEAAHKNIHLNWLSFISHLMRTSYIHAPIGKKENLNLKKETLDTLSELTVQSMFFDKRREVYEKLNDKKFTKNLNCNYEYVIPHYLMYSTLGRADLIFFQSSLDDIMPEFLQ